MNMKWFSRIIIALALAMSLYFYGQMPATMATHWGANGEVNGYSSTLFGLMIIPVMMAAMYALFSVLSNVDPMRKNIDKFRNYFDFFIVIMMGFFFYVQMIMIAWNLGYRFDISIAIVPAMAVLFYFAGVLTERSKRNWFIGLKTPWTMSSDVVWEKSNKLAGRLFKACGIVSLLSLLIVPKYTLMIIIVMAIFASVYPIIYSYYEYKKIVKKKR
ncbi:SdpI family protein [Candidatus Micrarchaeota archaeon]|nr:SdpI family protein [Candidatus Micrarchaeota archaeon]